jgi:AraC family transcriptional regulator, transcriptional activator of the genes for pyochelin and ferripyochelin receptors
MISNLKASKRYHVDGRSLHREFLPNKCLVIEHLPEKFGSDYSKIYQVNPGFNFIKTLVNVNCNLEIENSVDLQEPRLIITFCLKGNSRFLGRRGDEIYFSEGCVSVVLQTSGAGVRQYEADRSINQIRISCAKSVLENYFGERFFNWDFNASGHQVLLQKPIDRQAQLAISQLLSLQDSDPLHNLALHSQCLAVLLSELSEVLNPVRQESSSLKPKDQALAQMARDILVAEFSNPPSISDLARRVGTNEFKLKQLFHQYYHTTPYKLVVDTRMDHAYRLIKLHNHSIEMVADMVGYIHLSSFSSAFAKHFGISPTKLRSGKCV